MGIDSGQVRRGVEEGPAVPSLWTRAGWSSIARFWRAPNAVPQEIPGLDRLCSRILSYDFSKRAALRKLNEINRSYLQKRDLTLRVLAIATAASSALGFALSNGLVADPQLAREIFTTLAVPFCIGAIALLAPVWVLFAPRLAIHDALENAFAVVEVFVAER